MPAPSGVGSLTPAERQHNASKGGRKGAGAAEAEEVRQIVREVAGRDLLPEERRQLMAMVGCRRKLVEKVEADSGT